MHSIESKIRAFAEGFVDGANSSMGHRDGIPHQRSPYYISELKDDYIAGYRCGFQSGENDRRNLN